GGTLMKYYICFPLWGLRIPEAEAEYPDPERGVRTITLLRMTLTRPSSDHWRYLENTEVFYHSCGWGPPPIPWCLFAEAESDKPLTEFVESVEARIHRRVYLITLALRLSQAGWFLDPDLAEGIFTHFGSIFRKLGPYYLVYVDDDTTKPGYEDLYALHLHD